MTATAKIDMTDLISALVKFQEWQAEYADIRLHQKHDDAADQLMQALGIPTDHVSVLIGGSNAPILKRAADEIVRLRQFELAYRQWLEKTEWVQDAELEFPSLGMHRADVMRKEIDRLRKLVGE